MGIDVAPYWANWIVDTESHYAQQLILKLSQHAFKFHRASGFIGDATSA